MGTHRGSGHPPARPIVFVTDYGDEDTYAASLVGAAWRVHPELRCVSGTHGVPRGDVLGGAYHLKAAALAFGPDVVLCAVVDPGVGTSRRCLAAEASGVLCVAPDNGLVSYLWEEAAPDRRRAVELPVPAMASPTFAGRDLFAVVAARLAGGGALAECGRPITDPCIHPDAPARRRSGMGGDPGQVIEGRVAVVDHFGNAITTIRSLDLADARPVAAAWDGGRVTELVRTYDEITGPLAMLIGSAGHLEIAARGARALDAGGPGAHRPVRLEIV